MFTRKQQQIKLILPELQALGDLDGSAQKVYKSTVKQLPMMLRQSGLISTLVYLLGKAHGTDDQSLDSDKPEARLLSSLIKTLAVPATLQELPDYLQGLELQAYRQLSSRALQQLALYVQFSDALYPDQATLGTTQIAQPLSATKGEQP